MIQLARVTITPTEHRVLNTVYNQTIYFDKREDDINGTWFQIFMGVRNDHVNAAVRNLDALNILITRSGDYGKWISLNFDFDNWGKDCPESQTNDPYFLLPEEYQADRPQGEIEFSLYRPPVTATITAKPEPAPTVMTPEPLETPPLVPAPEPIEAPCIVAATPITSTTVAVSEESETLSLAPQPQPIDAPTVATATRSTSTLVGVSEIINTLDLTAMKQPTDALNNQIDDQLADTVTPSVSTSVATPEPIEQPQSAPMPIASTATASIPTFPLFALNYPPSLPKKLCASLAQHLKEIPRQEDAQRLDYSNAVADYNHLKRSIEATMKSAQCTFATALETMFYTKIWEKACQRLESLKKVLNIEETVDNLRCMSG